MLRSLILPVLACCFLALVPVSCGPPDEPRVITLGGPGTKPDPLKSYRCVETDDSRDDKLSVLEALQDRPELSQFAELIPEMKRLDLPVYLSMAEPEVNSTVTLLVPSNNAMDAFHVENPDVELNDDNLRKLVRQHVFIDYFDFDDYLDGGRRLISVDIEEIPYYQSDECVYVGDEHALFLNVNDHCFRGVIHVINKVMVPENGF